MNTHDDDTERLLRGALQDKAEAAESTLTFDDVRRGAEVRRRTGRRTGVLVAAAVLVAVGTPTAFLLRPGDDQPSPTPSPSLSTNPTPTPSSTATDQPASRGLSTVPRGPRPGIAYLLDGVVHEPDGSTQALPAAATDVVRFAPYHGGWIVLDSVGGLAQYDNTGHVVRQGGQESALAVSADQLQTAFLFEGHLYVGISNGMGDGEVDVTVGDAAHLIGFLRDRVVYSLSGHLYTVDGNGNRTVLPGASLADAASSNGDLLVGRVDGGSKVVAASTGRVLWTDPQWFAGPFSPDGRYLAAYQTATGGEFETVAILDARTGAVVARTQLDGIEVLPDVPPAAWDTDDSLLIPYRGPGAWAVLRLATDGTMTRATRVFGGSPDGGRLVFTARP